MSPARELPPSPRFAEDDGSCPAPLQRALAVDTDGRTAAVVQALAEVRVLVPLVARAGAPDSGQGLRTATASLVQVAGPDGRSVLPVFSSVATMVRWDPSARPMPVEGPRAALAAGAEGDGLLVLDPAGPVSVLVPRPAAAALAQGRAWVPSYADPEVAAAVTAALAGLTAGVTCERGRRAELAVALTVAPGLGRPALADLVAAVQEALAAAAVVAERVDSLELRVVAAG